MVHLTRHILCQDVGGIFFQLAILEFNLVYNRVHDWVVTTTYSDGLAIVIFVAFSPCWSKNSPQDFLLVGKGGGVLSIVTPFIPSKLTKVRNVSFFSKR
jgi:hypothetical protein